MELGYIDENNSFADRNDERNNEDDPCGSPMTTIYCSICLEVVAPYGDRSCAKLSCGHKFHLDCIGSAFNVKGAMECPNCRKMEDGRWLFANGRSSLCDINLEDLSYEEDLYELSRNAAMSSGGRWCPYNNFTSPHSPYEERDFTLNAFQESVPSTSQTRPYVAYFGPIYHHSSSPSSSNFNSHWNRLHVSSQNPDSHGLNATDLRRQYWERHPRRHVRRSHDVATSVPVPFASTSSPDHSASGTTSSSFSPEYQESNARTRNRMAALQAYYQQQPGNRRGDAYRRVPLPAESSADPNGLFYVPHRNAPESDHVSVHARYGDGENMCAGERGTTQSLTIHSDTGVVRSSVRMRQGTERVFWP